MPLIKVIRPFRGISILLWYVMAVLHLQGGLSPEAGLESLQLSPHLYHLTCYMYQASYSFLVCVLFVYLFGLHPVFTCFVHV